MGAVSKQRGREAPERKIFAFSELKLSILCTFGRNFLESLSDYAPNIIALRNWGGGPGAHSRAPDEVQALFRTKFSFGGFTEHIASALNLM